MKQFDRVEIIWIDSCQSGDVWIQPESIDYEYGDRSMYVITVGYFLKKTAQSTCITMSRRLFDDSGGDRVTSPFFIPTRAIKNIRVLKD